MIRTNRSSWRGTLFTTPASCTRTASAEPNGASERHSRWHPDIRLLSKLDLVQLERLLKCYEGTHDFRALPLTIEQLEKKAGREAGADRVLGRFGD
jgi:tRNA U38,U39,U40 pseudouridine synthase TruA